MTHYYNDTFVSLIKYSNLFMHNNSYNVFIHNLRIYSQFIQASIEMQRD